MIDVGPYRFTEQDAERTLFYTAELFDLLGADGVVADHRSRALAAAAAATSRDDALALRTVWTELLAASAAVRAAGVLGPDATGEVAHLAVSNGGVPKRSVDRVMVDWSGVTGDVQAARQHHGRPWQALCLWSREVIEGFVAEGHPLGLGSAGENITVTGIPWERVRPGARLQLGSVLCEVSAYALPCSKNAQWFSDRDFNRMHHERGPVSRVYATVIEPGAIAVGDRAVLVTT